MQFKVPIIMRRKHLLILCWFFPILLVVSFLIGKFSQLAAEINLRIPAIVIGVISLFLNVIAFRPQDGSTKPDSPLPKYQIQRLFHAIITAVAIFAILRYTNL